MGSQIDSFVRECLARGIARDTIREKLGQAGWAADEIEAALAEYAEIEFEIPVPRRRAYLPARETFFYLVLFATLYASALNAGHILFVLIERLLPDPLWGPDTLMAAAERVRGAAATLFIAFPVFLLVGRAIGRGLAREPERRASRVRKWLTYITLFVAAMVLIGNLSVLVWGLLSGEITARFALKALVVFLIAGAVFAHYAGGLRREEREGPLPARGGGWLARAAAVAGLAVIAVGFYVSGSPSDVRLRKLDLERVRDLHNVTFALTAFHYLNHRLPTVLDSIRYEHRARVAGALVDPVTGEPYGYRVLDSAAGRYELCAVFQTADTTGGRGGQFEPSDFWNHGPGRHCFTLTASEPVKPKDPRGEVVAPRP